MCGIAGYINLDGSPVDPEILTGMAAIQYHRGPDGFGWDAFSDAGVGFSHARLSIIDLYDTGRQPFRTEDGELLLAHNGEFYEYQKIRARLSALGDRFRTKSDSEIVLPLYRRYGLDRTLEHLRGEFAFSLYDKKKDMLFLVRDRFGIKPLYWAQTEKSLVFGSEIKAIFAHPAVNRKFSEEGLYHQLMQTMVPGSTPFDEIHQVKPGHVLIVERKNGAFRISQKKYWDVNFPFENEYEDRSESECIESVREGLLEAVQLRLVADVPVGCYLSGGIDSCSILGLASAVRQDHVKAFTIGFDNDDYDESPIAKEMADSVNADQYLMMLNSDDLYGNFVKTHWHTERTVYNTLAIAKFLMSQHVKNSGYKVVVTGEGSDELFAGYPGFRRDMFLHGATHLDDETRKANEEFLQKSNALVKGSMLAEKEISDPDLDAKIGFTPSSLQPWLSAAARVPGILEKGIRENLKNYSPGSSIASQIDGDMITGRHPLDAAQYV
ncbi:MAG: asparagine synthase (glutamine-hydrolyzing), partial [Spirochaetia bacterium]|nr:asparagine synthase (glutamine-hydrolyzing) [Spirochaetia bacterium]